MELKCCRLVIVILNYLNYIDTIECINSILDNKYNINGIVVVDNGSDNESYRILNNEYRNNTDVYVIKSRQNLGFARGNNIGIDYARKKLRANFVLVVNNDTVFIDRKYITKLVNHYEKGVGILGSRIVLKNGIEQNEVYEYIGLKDSFFRFINAWTFDRGSSFDFPIHQGKATQVLHGCALLFTPDFFKYYKGFYKRTFLYQEEIFLYFMCLCKGLKQVYVKETSIFHKEDRSSEMSFHNDSSIKGKYSRQSTKYIFLWALRYYILKKFSEFRTKMDGK